LKPATGQDAISSSGLAWPVGDFYVPGFSSDGRTGWVPGAPDTHRRLFLIRAAELQPELLATLRKVSVDDEKALSSWAESWHLADRWCQLLAHETLRWWAAHPEARGWEFEGRGVFSGFFPFKVEPLELGPFYHDPTWRRRRDFRKDVLTQVRHALDTYCDRMEAAALAAGLKRAPRHREAGHFDWLVSYQIKGESFASIATRSSYKFTGGRQTVRKAVVELAKYIELTLRSSTSAGFR
jgi:hypothetical protein